MEAELVSLGTTFGLGCAGGAVFALSGYLKYRSKTEKKPEFDMYKFLLPVLLGGFAGVGIFHFDLSFNEMEMLFVAAGFGATAKKFISTVTAVYNKAKTKTKKRVKK